MWITVATYGKASIFRLKDLWDTGYEEKGGLIGLGIDPEKRKQ